MNYEHVEEHDNGCLVITKLQFLNGKEVMSQKNIYNTNKRMLVSESTRMSGFQSNKTKIVARSAGVLCPLLQREVRFKHGEGKEGKEERCRYWGKM